MSALSRFNKSLVLFLAALLLLPSPAAAEALGGVSGLRQMHDAAGLESALAPQQAGLEATQLSRSISGSNMQISIRPDDLLVSTSPAAPGSDPNGDTIKFYRVDSVNDTVVMVHPVQRTTLRVDRSHSPHQIHRNELGIHYRALATWERHVLHWIKYIRQKSSNHSTTIVEEAVRIAVTDGQVMRLIPVHLPRPDQPRPLRPVAPPIPEDNPEPASGARDTENAKRIYRDLGETGEIDRTQPLREKDLEFILSAQTDGKTADTTEFGLHDGSQAQFSLADFGDAGRLHVPENMFQVLTETGILEHLDHAEKLILSGTANPAEVIHALERALGKLDQAIYSAFGGDAGPSIGSKWPGAFPTDRLETGRKRGQSFPPIEPLPELDETGETRPFISIPEFYTFLIESTENALHHAIRVVYLTEHRRQQLEQIGYRRGHHRALAFGLIATLALAVPIGFIFGNRLSTEAPGPHVETSAPTAAEVSDQAGLESLQDELFPVGYWVTPQGESTRYYQITQVLPDQTLIVQPILWPNDPNSKNSSTASITKEDRKNYRYIPPWSARLAWLTAQTRQAIADRPAVQDRMQSVQSGILSSLDSLRTALLVSNPNPARILQLFQGTSLPLRRFLETHADGAILEAKPVRELQDMRADFDEQGRFWIEQGTLDAQRYRRGLISGAFSISTAATLLVSFTAVALATGALAVALNNIPQSPPSIPNSDIAHILVEQTTKTPAEETVPSEPAAPDEPAAVAPTVPVEPADPTPFVASVSDDGKTLTLEFSEAQRKALAGKWLVSFLYLASGAVERTDFLSQGTGPVQVPPNRQPLSFMVNNTGVWPSEVGWPTASDIIFIAFPSEASAQTAWERANAAAVENGNSPDKYLPQVFPGVHSVWSPTIGGTFDRIDRTRSGLEALSSIQQLLGAILPSADLHSRVVLGRSAASRFPAEIDLITGLADHLLVDSGLETVVALLQADKGTVQRVNYYGSPAEGSRFRQLAAAAGLEVNFYAAGTEPFRVFLTTLLRLLGAAEPALASGLEALDQAISLAVGT